MSAATKKNPGIKYYGIMTEWDAIDRNNLLEVNGGGIAGNFDIGISTSKRGGQWHIKGLSIEADLPFSWTGVADIYGPSFCHILIDGVAVKSKKYMHITGYDQPNENYLEHRNTVIPAESNLLSSTYGLEGNQYKGGRVIVGDKPPSAETHGLPGDIYRLKAGSGEWVCTKAGYYNERSKGQVPATWIASGKSKRRQ